MPRAVAGAEPTNQHASPGETGYVAPEAQPEPEAPVAEPEAEAAVAEPETETPAQATGMQPVIPPVTEG